MLHTYELFHSLCPVLYLILDQVLPAIFLPQLVAETYVESRSCATPPTTTTTPYPLLPWAFRVHHGGSYGNSGSRALLPTPVIIYRARASVGTRVMDSDGADDYSSNENNSYNEELLNMCNRVRQIV